MQTGTTDNSRLGYAKGGKIQHMADGGLVSSLIKKLRPKTGNERYAEYEAAQAKAVAAPKPADAATSPAPAKGGALNPANALAAREKAAGLAKGGPVPNPPKGAAPHPEATGTDTVPIMGTPGEFMVKKAAVDKLGVDFMEKINSIADGDEKPKLGKVKRKRRGKRKPMAAGGLVTDETGRPLRLPAPTPGTAVATTPYRPNFTMPQQFAQPPAAPPALPAPPAKPLPQVDVQRQSWQGRTGSPQAEAWQQSRQPAAAPAAAPAALPRAPAAPQSRLGRIARTAGNAVGPTAVGLSVIPEALDTATVAMDPNSTGIDVATQAAQGTGRIGAAGAGAAMGAKLGALTGPLAAVGVPIGALAGGAIGYYGADKAIEAGRAAVGADPRAPVDRLGQVQMPLPPTGAGAGRGFVNPAAVVPAPGSASGTAPMATEADAAVAPPPANITRVGNSYTGAPGISGPVTINGQAPRGGFVGNAGTGAPVRLGANPSIDMALSEARDQAMTRGDFDAVRRSYGGDFGQAKVDPITALINNGKPMTTRKAAAIAQLQASMAQAENASATRGMEGQRLAMDKETADLTNREKKAIISAQEAYANAAPADKPAALEKLQALTGRTPKEAANRFTVVPGGQEIEGGLPVTRTASVINNQTGEFVQQPNARQALPPGLKVGAPTKQPDGTYNAAGRTVVIQGGKVTEIK